MYVQVHILILFYYLINFVFILLIFLNKVVDDQIVIVVYHQDYRYLPNRKSEI